MIHQARCRRSPLFAAVLLSSIFMAAAALAHHPFVDGEQMFLKQPDGTRLEVRVYGDGWYARIENTEGYTLVRDPDTEVICYARLSADGRRLESTGVSADQPAPAGLRRGLEEPLETRRARRDEVRDRFQAEEEAFLADKSALVSAPNQGDVLGLTLIIDFSDEPGTVPAADFDGYLNEVGYTGYGNNGSVREYFHEVSSEKLSYNNWVPAAYIRAPQPKSYYDDPDVTHGIRARELVAWALNYLNGLGHDFSVYDSNGDGYIDAINVFYAGYPDWGWAVGLWPHSWTVSFSADGVSSYKYQISNIGTSLRLGTFCHENGHMIMFWPDLYDYGGESSGVGQFCLMCSVGSGTNPVKPCGYLRAMAGWQTPVLLSGLQAGLSASADDMNVFKVPYLGHPNEYYIIENRYRSGRDASLPAPGGLAVWHVDEYGSNDNEQMLPGEHYRCTLVQADGRWDLEHSINNGDAGDLWRAPLYTQFDPTTVPAATWWNGSDAPIFMEVVSPEGPVMTFNYREALGNMAVTADPQPSGLAAPWTLALPSGGELEGVGFDDILVWEEGTYSLIWGDVKGWSLPDPISETFEIGLNGTPAHIVGTYTDPPFTSVAVGAAADPGSAAAVSAIDVDGDGDQDLHVVNDGSADLLLRNDGGFAFVDITPPGLDDSGTGRAAAWADYDNDGDLDLYLVRYGQANVMYQQQEGGLFTDVTAVSPFFNDAGNGVDAQWTDFDGDGLLDLYLVQDGSANFLFRNYGDFGAGSPVLFSQAYPVVQHDGPGAAAAWSDFDRDGDLDVYVVNDGESNLLAANFGALGFEDTAEAPGLSWSPGRDAVWGDFDNDGDQDLFVVNDGVADVMHMNTAGAFETVAGTALTDAGAARAVTAADFDNDGNLDLYLVRSGQDDLLVFGDGAWGFGATFMDVPETAGLCTSAVCADFDGDGGVDVYLGRAGQTNVMLRNTIAGRGHWLAVDLIGDELNVSGIGAVVRVVTAAGSQMREAHAGDGVGHVSLTQHFGLGDIATVDSLIVNWPDGDVTVQTGVAGDRVLTVYEKPDLSPVPEAGTPAVTRLHRAYPNPFNPVTTIAFDLAQDGAVRLDVYGLDGRLVATLVNENRPSGRHEVTWRGTDRAGRPVASGTYFCRMSSGTTVNTVRLTLVK